MGDLVQLEGIHRLGLPGFFSLKEGPQAKSIADQCLGISAWGEFSRLCKVYPGQLIVVTGVPGHGKSTFILNMLAKMAREHGTVTWAYVPENEGFLREKLRRIWQNEKTWDHFSGEQFFYQSAVPEFNPNDFKSMDWVLNRAAKAIQEYDWPSCVVLIDPWNELDRARQRDESVTDYIGRSLILVKDFCRGMRATVIIVAHPTKAVSDKETRPPGLYDVEGSANWFNKMDNGLVVWRDMETNTAKVSSLKVRYSPDAGEIGAAFFHVDKDTGVFTPQIGTTGYEP